MNPALNDSMTEFDLNSLTWDWKYNTTYQPAPSPSNSAVGGQFNIVDAKTSGIDGAVASDAPPHISLKSSEIIAANQNCYIKISGVAMFAAGGYAGNGLSKIIQLGLDSTATPNSILQPAWNCFSFGRPSSGGQGILSARINTTEVGGQQTSITFTAVILKIGNKVTFTIFTNNTTLNRVFDIDNLQGYALRATISPINNAKLQISATINNIFLF